MIANSPETTRQSPLSMLRRHAKRMTIAFAVVMAGTFAYTALSTPLYTSQAKVFVRLGRESVGLDPTATTGETITFQDTRENELNSIQELLNSRKILEQIVDTVGAYVILDKSADEVDNTETKPTIWSQLNPFVTYSARDKAINRLAKRFKVEVIRKSNIINISCEASSPELAQQIVELGIKFASDTHLRINRTAGSYDFFVNQAERQSDELQQHEAELRRLKNNTGIAELNAQRQVHIKRIADLEERRLLAETTLQSALAEVAERRKVLNSLPETHITSEITGNPQTAAAKMREQLYALELKEQDISTKFQEGTFVVDQIRAQVAAAKKTLKDESDPLQVTKSLNAAHQAMQNALLDVQSKVSGYKAQVAALDTQLASAKRGLELFNEHETQMVHLERQIELEKGSFKKYAENREQARIDQDLERKNITNLNILQNPSRSATPTSPRVLMNLSFGFVLAMFSAFAAAIFSEWRGDPATAVVTGDDDRWYATREEESVQTETPAAEASEEGAEDLDKDRNLALPTQPR
jgi:uncharacterized protein involved in exopolysaccharide biosynthesis